MSGVKNRVTVKGTVQARKTVRGGIGYRTLQGEPGKDGISPSARVDKSGDTATITITDADGTTTATVKDGQTPQKGVDYLTPGEVHDVAEEVLQDKIITDMQDDISDVKETLTDKLDAPQTAGTQGQVLTSDGQGGQSWEDPTGGGGTVTDVQVNGTSILDAQGVANVPKASQNELGVVKIDSSLGLYMNTNGNLGTNPAGSALIKGGTANYYPLVPQRQHESTFYGLAKAAGDTTQSASSNAVGQYTEDAKSKIHDMLDAPVTVSGTTPTITGKAGIRYICGEVSTLSITAPESGCIDVVFTSGSTPTVLTVTSAKSGVTAIKWANGFDPTALDASTTYELNILDGELGVAGLWT